MSDPTNSSSSSAPASAAVPVGTPPQGDQPPASNAPDQPPGTPFQAPPDPVDPHRDDQERGASEPGYQAPSPLPLLDEGAEFDTEAHVERAQSILSAMKAQNDRAPSEAKVHPTHWQQLMDIIRRFAQEVEAKL